MSPIESFTAKALIRNEMASQLAALSAEDKKRQSKAVFEKIINHPYYKVSKRVALYMSTADEIDTAQENMIITKLGIVQHSKYQLREDALEGGGLDLLIIPGVAFSRNGGRVGHGSGYYDRFLAKVRCDPEKGPKVLAVGFSCQVMEEVPMDEHDQKIDEMTSSLLTVEVQ